MSEGKKYATLKQAVDNGDLYDLRTIVYDLNHGIFITYDGGVKITSDADEEIAEFDDLEGFKDMVKKMQNFITMIEGKVDLPNKIA